MECRPRAHYGSNIVARACLAFRGDEVITSGGIVGKIERVLGDDKVDITIADNVTVQVVQSTVQSLSNKPATKK